MDYTTYNEEAVKKDRNIVSESFSGINEFSRKLQEFLEDSIKRNEQCYNEIAELKNKIALLKGRISELEAKL